MAGVAAIVNVGELLVLTVAPLTEGPSPLWFERVSLNEGRIATTANHGRVLACPLFADDFESNNTSTWSVTVR